jgi:glyoxylase-like metal-dependent hydrolase (beta-lactamase superfamily II)
LRHDLRRQSIGGHVLGARKIGLALPFEVIILCGAILLFVERHEVGEPTPGHQSLRIRLPDGDVVLCSDACYMRRSLDEMLLPGSSLAASEDDMLDGLQRLARLRRQGARLIYGHDPEQWKLLNSGPLEEITWSKLAAAQASPA